MKKLAVALLVLLLAAGCGKTADGNGQQEKTFKQISMDEAAKLMEELENYVILDVRTEAEYAEGHIPDAINYPNEKIDKDEIAVLPDKNQTVLVYCRSGNRSKQAAMKLVNLGYTNIIEIGGIISWKGLIVK